MNITRPANVFPSGSISQASEKVKPNFNFKEARASGKFVITCRDLVIGYDTPLSKPLNLVIERGHKYAIRGANGIGKSTILMLNFLSFITKLWLRNRISLFLGNIHDSINALKKRRRKKIN